MCKILIYFWHVGAGGGAGGACCAGSLACPLVQVVGLFGASGPAKRLALVLWSCVPSFCPLSRSSLVALLANMPLFRVFRGFLEGFGAFVWVCVVLVLCVACGAFVCVSG